MYFIRKNDLLVNDLVVILPSGLGYKVISENNVFLI
jgi:hypothetical protein